MPPTSTGARNCPPTVRSKRCICLVRRSYTPWNSKPVPMGQFTGNAPMPSTRSRSSSSCSGSPPRAAPLVLEGESVAPARADGPVHRKRADAEHALQFIEQLQRLAHRPVALVHEGEDWHPALAADLE